MPTPNLGDRYTFAGDVGLAAAAREADSNVDDHLTAEHAELDLTPGTAVTVCGYDDERDLVLVEWTDVKETPRVTSIDPAMFELQFDPEV
jgi:hypothetical protein